MIRHHLPISQSLRVESSPRHASIVCCAGEAGRDDKNPIAVWTNPNLLVCCLYRWSAVSRTERYRKRCGDEGNPTVDETNPLPKLIDPITLEPVVTPAISPFGHVMGLATWKVESHN